MIIVKHIKILLVALVFSSTIINAEENPKDPYEGFNRGVYTFNDTIDGAILKPIAMGYSYVTPDVAKKGINIIDADEISRNLQKKGQAGYEAIVKKYGSEVLMADESLDRTKLREIAFKKQADKKWLEELMHPLIREKILEAFRNINSKWTIYSAPL